MSTNDKTLRCRPTMPGKKLLIVGGFTDMVMGSLSQKVSQAGSSIEWHAENENLYRGIPAGCEGVAVLKEMCSHVLFDLAKEDATKAGIPLAIISRKWSKTKEQLRNSGLLPPLRTPDTLPTPQVLADEALRIILDIRRSQNRTPTKTWIESSLRNRFGDKVSLSADAYREAISKALAELPPTFIAPPTPLHLTPIPQPPPPTLRDWTTLLITEDPSVILKPTTLASEVTKHLGHQATPDEVTPIIAEFRDAWKKPLAATTLIYDYLVTRFKQGAQDKENWPKSREIQETTKAIFGHTPVTAVLKKARMEVLGDWADDFITPSAADRYLLDNNYTICNSESLLIAESLQGVCTEGRWYTSLKALDTFLNSQTLTPETPMPPTTIPIPPKAAKPQPTPEPPTMPVVAPKPPVVVPETPTMVPDKHKEDDLLTLASMISEDLIARMITQLTPITERLTLLEARRKTDAETHQAQTKSLQDKLNQLSSHLLPLADLETKTSQIETRLRATQEKLSKTDAHLAPMQEHLLHIETRLTPIQDALHQVEALLTPITKHLTQLEAQLTQHTPSQDTLTRIEASLGELQQTVNAIEPIEVTISRRPPRKSTLDNPST